MITLKQLNKFIAANWPELDIEMVKGKGYYYYVGHFGYEMESTLVNILNCTTREWWEQEITGAVNAAKEKIEADDTGPVRKEGEVIILGRNF